MRRRNGFRHFVLISALVTCCLSRLSAFAPADEATKETATWKVTLRLLDPDGKPVAGGKVIAYQETGEETPEDPWGCLNPVDPREVVSGPDGSATVSYPKRPEKELYIDVKAEGYVFLQYHFPLKASDGKVTTLDKVPSRMDVRLSRGEAAGGVVRNKKGKPIEGVRVCVAGLGSLFAPDESEQPRPLGLCVLKTDAEGKWSCRLEAAEGRVRRAQRRGVDIELSQVWVQFSHPDFADRQVQCMDDSGSPDQAVPVTGGLFGVFFKEWGLERTASLTFDTVLDVGHTVEGRVVDEDGNGIPDARLTFDGSSFFLSGPYESRSQADGRFKMEHLPGKRYLLITSRDGYAPSVRDETLRQHLTKTEITMKQGEPMTLCIRDAEGKPVRASVSIQRSASGPGPMSISCNLADRLGLPPIADKTGSWTWKQAPDEPLPYTIAAQGFEMQRLRLGPGRHTIRMKKTFQLRGRVVDAVTKQPIPRFYVSTKDAQDGPLCINAFGDWTALPVAENQDGAFSYPEDDYPYLPIDLAETGTSEKRPDLFLRIEADGYAPLYTERIRAVGGTAERTFKMKRAANITGRVVDAEGTPVAGADVAVVGSDLARITLNLKTLRLEDVEYCRIGRNFTFESSDSADSPEPADPAEPAPSNEVQPRLATTDAEGRFTLFPQSKPYGLVVVHEKGYVHVAPEDVKPGQDIVLEEWARLEGVVRAGEKPLSGIRVGIRPEELTIEGRNVVEWECEPVETDANGRLRINRIPPGEVRLYQWEAARDGSVGTSVFQAMMQAMAGNSPNIRTVTGRCVLPKEAKDRIDLARSHAFLTTPEDAVRSASLDVDGTFRIEGVPVDRKCELFFVLREKGKPGARIVAHPQAEERKRLTVPAPKEQDSAESFELKKIPVEMTLTWPRLSETGKEE